MNQGQDVGLTEYRIYPWARLFAYYIFVPPGPHDTRYWRPYTDIGVTTIPLTDRWFFFTVRHSRFSGVFRFPDKSSQHLTLCPSAVYFWRRSRIKQIISRRFNVNSFSVEKYRSTNIWYSTFTTLNNMYPKWVLLAKIFIPFRFLRIKHNAPVTELFIKSFVRSLV